MASSVPCPPPSLQGAGAKVWEQKKFFISPGILPNALAESGLLKPDHLATPQGDSGEAGCQAGREGTGGQGCFVHSAPFSVSLSTISKLVHSSPAGTTVLLKKTKAKPAVSGETSRFYWGHKWHQVLVPGSQTGLRFSSLGT